LNDSFHLLAAHKAFLHSIKMSTSKPVIVLVPGAWHKVAQYSPLTNRLRDAGYEVHPVDYPSTGPNPTHTTFEPDVKEISSVIESIADRGDDVMVVVHSAAGIIAGSAAKGHSKADREADGKNGGITHLVYIAAFAAPEGVSLYDATNGPGEWHMIDGHLVRPEDPKKRFYNTCPDDVADMHVKDLQPFALCAFESKATYAAWKHIPSTYLLCENDQAIPVAAQEYMTTQEGANFDVVRCKSDHSPFLGMPDFTANVVRRAAGEGIDL
jgi:hypothetical protein